MKTNNFLESRLFLLCLGVVMLVLGFWLWWQIAEVPSSTPSYWFQFALGEILIILAVVIVFLLYLDRNSTNKEPEKDVKDKYNLFLDDERMPIDCATYMSSFRVDCKIYHQPWEIVRSYSQFKEIIERRGLPDLISFDHDLADNWKLREALDVKEWFNEEESREYTGLDCAKWLTQHCEEKDLLLPKFVVHSANPVGRENVKSYLTNFQLRQNLTINGVNWNWQKDTKEFYVWTGQWYSLDGDGVRLYVQRNETGFSLECFSGIPSSAINIDSIDYGALWHKAGFLQPIGDYTYVQQSVLIANYLCSLFCEK